MVSRKAQRRKWAKGVPLGVALREIEKRDAPNARRSSSEMLAAGLASLKKYRALGSVEIERRDRLIVQCRDYGATWVEIARAVNLSPQAVQQIAKKRGASGTLR